MSVGAAVNIRMIIKFMGILLLLLAPFMALAGAVSLYNNEHAAFRAIMLGCLITIGVGIIMFFAALRHDHKNIGRKEGYIIVTLAWVFISLFGALPLFLYNGAASFTDAFFETMSGFTTTGATILTDIEALSKGILFWRNLTNWIGGMGIIILTLAILPILGVGGMQLFVAEAPGTTPMRLHPRITETAKRLWGIYIIFTLLQTSLHLFGGMSLFDSITHAFSTMATGGFSPNNDSIAGFSAFNQYVIVLFMILAGANFSLPYFMLKGQFNKVVKNDELRFYLIIIGLFTAIISFGLFLSVPIGFESAFRNSLFQVVSIVTTTGFITADYEAWPGTLLFLIFLLMFAGGCMGSTAGGIKMIRHLVLFKNIQLEFKRHIHPLAVVPVKVNGKTIPADIIHNFLAFFIIYMLTFAAGSVALTLLGLDFESAIGASVAALGNIGPGIGSVGAIDNYAHVPNAGKWILSFLMLLGRLELFTVLLLLSPSFYRK